MGFLTTGYPLDSDGENYIMLRSIGEKCNHFEISPDLSIFY
jgi:hypothetical protein